MKLLAISGQARHGKDTVATIIEQELQALHNKVFITHYADLLKYICKTFCGWNGNKDEEGRQLLQYVGTNLVRKKKPDFWVDFMSDILDIFQEKWDYVIISDARFPNEIDNLRNKGFDVTHLRVMRQNFKSSLTEEQLNHPSETALNNIKPDFYIHNDGSIEDLEKTVIKWIKENLI